MRWKARNSLTNRKRECLVPHLNTTLGCRNRADSQTNHARVENAFLFESIATRRFRGLYIVRRAHDALRGLLAKAAMGQGCEIENRRSSDLENRCCAHTKSKGGR